MAIEPRRGCGYRKVGGTYIMGGKLSAPCCRFPILLDVCPCCGMGIRLTRTWTWIDPRPWLETACTTPANSACPASSTNVAQLGKKVGLINIGAGFYRTIDEFTREASTLGISRRVQALPRNFKLGETWVFLAHPRVKEIQRMVYKIVGDRNKVLDTAETEDEAQEVFRNTPGACRIDAKVVSEWRGGIFAMFKPTAVEKLVTVSQRAAMEQEELDKYERQGITLVEVPDNDHDHQGSVYDEDEAELELA